MTEVLESVEMSVDQDRASSLSPLVLGLKEMKLGTHLITISDTAVITVSETLRRMG